MSAAEAKPSSSSPSTTTPPKWFPLESNPQLMNDYIAKLGFNTNLYQFCDVYSTEDWALAMVPQPVAAVVLLYPLTEKQESYRHQDQLVNLTELLEKAESGHKKDDGNDNVDEDEEPPVWFTKQRIGNACGTIGILHALQNAPSHLRASAGGCYQPHSWLAKFAADTPPSLDPVAKAERLEHDTEIATLHDAATSAAQNATPRGNIDDELDTHFIALVHKHGRLLELDGRKEAPVDHGTTTETRLLLDAVTVIQEKFMQRDPTEVRFTMLALAPVHQNEEEQD